MHRNRSRIGFQTVLISLWSFHRLLLRRLLNREHLFGKSQFKIGFLIIKEDPFNLIEEKSGSLYLSNF